MDPKHAARRLATLGYLLLLLAFLLRGLSLGLTIDASRSAFAPPPDETITPAAGHYTLAADGRQILFEQQTGPDQATAWFSIPVEGGLPSPAAAPEVNTNPFNLRSGKLYLRVGNGAGMASGSPPDMTVGVTALSPQGKMMAFSAFRSGHADWSLFILSASGELNWLGDFPTLGDLDWSPDEQQIAFVARADQFEQVFTIDRGGQRLRQLTHDAGRKSQPRWSPDGRQIAYLVGQDPEPTIVLRATPTVEPLFPPTPAPYADGPSAAAARIALVNADGTGQQMLNTDPDPEYNLFWLRTAQGDRLAYTLRRSNQPQAADLYALDPQTGQQRRLYPPLALDSLQCPAVLSVNGSDEVKATLTNSTLAALDAPVLMRSGPRAFAVAGPRDTGQLRAQSLAIPAGQSGSLTWPVSAAREPATSWLDVAKGLIGEKALATHVSLLINLGSPYTMDERHCVILNTTYLGLPDLSFLPLMPPLTVAGMLLCLPWLRHQKNRWLWAAWASAPLLSLLLIAIECAWIYHTI